MNMARRKELREIIARIELLQEEAEEIRDALEALSDEEGEYKESIPENLQGSARYEKAETAYDALISAVDALEATGLDEAIDSIREAIDA